MTDYTQKKGLTSQQKTGFVLLLVFGLLAIGLGFLQMRNNIYGPFVRKAPSSISQAQALLDTSSRLQGIDTDQDGLYDYEELNFYETSPYLPDTDSDGIDDRTEIDEGSDPLCPAGKSCAVSEEMLTTTTQQITSKIGEDVITPIDVIGNVSDSVLTESGLFDVETLLNDANELRKLLLGTGQISEEQLNQLSDEELLDFAKEVLKDMNNE